MQAEEVDAKMIAALVAGVRRAFPFVEEDDVEAVLEEHSPALFRVCHTAPLGVALQVCRSLVRSPRFQPWFFWPIHVGRHLCFFRSELLADPRAARNRGCQGGLNMCLQYPVLRAPGVMKNALSLI